MLSAADASDEVSHTPYARRRSYGDEHGRSISLWREETIPENPVKQVQLPKGLKKDKRPRVTPTDAEFAAFMACWDVSEELHLKALTARCFGGMRTSDLHTWDRTHVDLEGFASAQVYRPKTDDEEDGASILEELVIPDMLRHPHMAW